MDQAPSSVWISNYVTPFFFVSLRVAVHPAWGMQGPYEDFPSWVQAYQH